MITLRKLAFFTLRVVVALVCAWGAVDLLRAVAAGHGPRLPHMFLLVIAIAEIVAAAVFLFPGKPGKIAGYVLLFILLSALTVHLLHGDHGVLNLVVYAAAVWAVLAAE